jgi:small subunit ribosomal protein S19
MSRSLKKGPYVDEALFRKVQIARAASSHMPIKTWSRACTIVPEFVGTHFEIHNGKTFIKLYVTEDMVGHKLGEFAPTRTFRAHTARQAAAAPPK